MAEEPEEDLVGKAETEFFQIIEAEKKKREKAAEQAEEMEQNEKGDQRKVSLAG